MNDAIRYGDTLPGGRHWSFLARVGTTLELTDIEGGGNVGMLLYNPANPLERLNLPDTLKCQHTFKLTAGHCLYSDMGRIFCSITADSVGWHDASSGTCNAGIVAGKWVTRDYQEARDDYHRNGRDCFLIELGKYGLGRRDMAANVNWFSRVDVTEDGDMALAEGNSPPGASLTLRFEMDTLVLMHTCPHRRWMRRRSIRGNRSNMRLASHRRSPKTTRVVSRGKRTAGVFRTMRCTCLEHKPPGAKRPERLFQVRRAGPWGTSRERAPTAWENRHDAGKRPLGGGCVSR